jgi:hypothetical protein
MEQLSTHGKECLFNPRGMVTCDKGCGTSLMRCETMAHSCISYLIAMNKRLEKDKMDLISSLEGQKQAFEEEKRLMDQKEVDFVRTVAQLKAMTTRLTERNGILNLKVLTMTEELDSMRESRFKLRNMMASTVVSLESDQVQIPPKPMADKITPRLKLRAKKSVSHSKGSRLRFERERLEFSSESEVEEIQVRPSFKKRSSSHRMN